jgi:hypothetical protein
MLKGGSMPCSVIIVDGPKTTIIQLEDNVWRQGKFNEFVFNVDNFKNYGPFTEYKFPAYKDVSQCIKERQDPYDCTLNGRYIEPAPWPFNPRFSYATVKDPMKLWQVLRYDLKNEPNAKAKNVRIPYQAIVDSIHGPKVSSEWEVGLFFDSM